MNIIDNIKSFSSGLALGKSLAYSVEGEDYEGSNFVLSDSLKSFILGLLVSGGITVPYTPPPEPITTFEQDIFYNIMTVRYPESVIVDLAQFYNAYTIRAAGTYIIDLAQFYDVSIITPEVIE